MQNQQTYSNVIYSMSLAVALLGACRGTVIGGDGNTAALRRAPAAKASTIAVPGSGTTTFDITKATTVSGFARDTTGAAFDWGFMTSQGAFLEYTLSVATAGNYSLVVNYASEATSAATVTVNTSGATALPLPSTTNWAIYENTTAETLALPAAKVLLRITAASSQDYNIAGISLAFASATGGTTTTGGGTTTTGGGTTTTGGGTTTTGGAGGTTTGGSVGTHPSALPSRMLVGLADNDGTWMGSSGVKWDVRWAYFTSNVGVGWYNGWAGGAASINWAQSWMQDAVSQGFIPGVHFYNIQSDYSPSTASGTDPSTNANILVGGGEARLQSASVMKDYFTKLKVFFQAAKTINSPVVMIVEGDVFAFIESQSGNNPTTYAAIADSGVPELAGLPNTVAGFALAFLQLRKSVGANNVVMGPDLPSYSSVNGDFLNYTVTADLPTQVTYQFTDFFSHFGVGSATNAVGAQFDFIASCPASADTDLYAAYGDTGRSWNASDSAPINSESFNRYAAWLSLYYAASKTPWLLWQIPLGNSNSPDVYNQEGAWAGPYPANYVLPAGCNSKSTTGCPGGYKDNRPEYFFGTGSAAHLNQFAKAGVFGLFFGAGTGGAADQTDDYYTDGTLFFKTRAGAFIAAGGFPLAN